MGKGKKCSGVGVAHPTKRAHQGQLCHASYYCVTIKHGQAERKEEGGVAYGRELLRHGYISVEAWLDQGGVCQQNGWWKGVRGIP